MNKKSFKKKNLLKKKKKTKTKIRMKRNASFLDLKKLFGGSWYERLKKKSNYSKQRGGGWGGLPYPY